MHMNKLKNAVLIVFLAALGSVLCGALWSRPSVVIDTEKNIVYEYITAETLVNDFSEDSGKAESRYDGKFFLVAGLYETGNDGENSFSIMDRNMNSVSCSYSKNTSVSDRFSFKDKVAVYGKLKYSFGKYELTDVQKIIPAPAARSSEIYYTLDGTFADRSASVERELNNGKIKFYIPKAFTGIENSIKDDETGEMEGFQYNLSKLSADKSNEPEALFVCYFDKKLLRETSDITRTNDVEKLIIQNIENKNSIVGFPSKKIKTYYDAEYQYYRGNFTSNVGTGYRTEYVFQKAGDDGILVYLYLYKEEKHISDVMLITRMLEINE